MPPGERLAMVDRYAKFHREASQAARRCARARCLRYRAPTARWRRLSWLRGATSAELVIFNLAGWIDDDVEAPAFPMFGALTYRPARCRRAAILAPICAIPPHRRSPDMPNVMAWAVENALFMLDLAEQPVLRARSRRRKARAIRSTSSDGRQGRNMPSCVPV